MRLVLVFLGVVLLIAPAAAVDPREMLSDPLMETRAREISKGLRCVVCQNQSIDDSDAPLARDLRVLVRERLAAGDSDGEVVDYVVSRYGDFVLLKPPFKLATAVLWAGPVVFALLALLALFGFYRRQGQGQDQGAPKETRPTPLNDAERARLNDFLGKDGP